MNDPKIAQRFKTTFVFFSLSGIVFFVLLVVGLLGIVRIRQVEQKITVAREKLQTYQQVLGAVPEKALADKKMQAEQLKTRGADIVVPQQRKAMSRVTPLDFKKHFFDTQSLVKDKSAKKEVPFPAYLGFDEYKEKMPAENDAARLTQGLAAVRDTVMLLIDSGVRAITSVSLNPKQNGTPEAAVAPAPMPFSAFTFGLSFETSFSGLRQFLIGLAEQESTYVIKEISTQLQNGQSGYLRVEMVVEYITL